MVVLSLFDGMSCGQIALERAGVYVEKYIASEIEQESIAVTQSNYPNTLQVGDITRLKYKDGALYSNEVLVYKGIIDLMIGGSPCQSISNLGDGSGLEGKSGLFFHFHRLLTEIKPKKFLLENVRGNKKAIKAISDLLGVEPVLFNSNLVSAQNRTRLYWTNIEFKLPKEKDIPLSSVLETEIKDTHKLSPGRLKWITEGKGLEVIEKRYASLNPIKAQCLTARGDASWNCTYVTRFGTITKLSPEEWEILQTVPVGYTDHVKTKDRYKMLGNGWTVDVIAHIFKNLTNTEDYYENDFSKL